MRGVVAAGAAATAEAGAEILERGGNAIDAAVGACFATSAGEPALTSLGAGGFLLHRAAASGETWICDFFADAPRLPKADLVRPDFHAVDIDFGPTSQRFHIGRAAAAVPGAIPGLCTAHARWGKLSLREVVAPAARMLREGVVIGPYQGYTVQILRPIVTRHPECRALFAPAGRLIEAGERFAAPELAATLEQLAEEGWQRYYERVVWPAILAGFGPARGGLICYDDLQSYRVHFREPLELEYRGRRLYTNPPPSTGGSMIGLMLEMLATLEVGALAGGSREHMLRLAQAMMVADETRATTRDLWGERVRARQRFAALGDELTTAPSDAGPSATTHVSVLDAEGNAASVTFSYGEGNGHVIEGTGIVMNNLMGEADLFPDGFDRAPCGSRLTSMMAPSLLLEPDGAVTVLGTGGANRIRSAIMQVVSALCDYGLDPEAAVAAPRIHFERGVLNAEVLTMADGGASLDTLGAERVVRFNEPSLFFGGVHLVQRSAAGRLSGAGDPRRGGACRIV